MSQNHSYCSFLVIFLFFIFLFCMGNVTCFKNIHLTKMFGLKIFLQTLVFENDKKTSSSCLWAAQLKAVWGDNQQKHLCRWTIATCSSSAATLWCHMLKWQFIYNLFGKFNIFSVSFLLFVIFSHLLIMASVFDKKTEGRLSLERLVCWHTELQHDSLKQTCSCSHSAQPHSYINETDRLPLAVVSGWFIVASWFLAL